MATQRLEELGLKLTLDSMLDLLEHSRFEDTEIFYDRSSQQWVIRHWHEPDASDPDEQWGAVYTGTTLREAAETAIYGMHFS